MILMLGDNVPDAQGRYVSAASVAALARMLEGFETDCGRIKRAWTLSDSTIRTETGEGYVCLCAEAELAPDCERAIRGSICAEGCVAASFECAEHADGFTRLSRPKHILGWELKREK